MNAKAVFLVLWLPCAALAQGFAGMATDATGFTLPAPNPTFSFPQDHGPHPEYRIEWWYLTANLTGPDGTAYGLQWTLFRSALAPHEADGWNSPQVWLGHAAVTTPEHHFVAERFARGGIGQAGVEAEPFEAWIDDWRLSGPDFDDLRMTASGSDFSYDMTLTANGPLVFHGQEGYSVKSEDGRASYYYSQPFFEIRGALTLPDGVVPVTGQAWLDREWSSQPLADNQTGWDWFSLSFDTGDKLMVAQLRARDRRNFFAGTWITADGTASPVPQDAVTLEPRVLTRVASRDVPTRWRVALPDRGVDVMVEALNPAAWMALSIPYWEGPVRVAGSHTGVGYLEMTGYE